MKGKGRIQVVDMDVLVNGKRLLITELKCKRMCHYGRILFFSCKYYVSTYRTSTLMLNYRYATAIVLAE